MAKKLEVGIIGLGKFGFALAQRLVELGHSVVGVDGDERAIRRAQSILAQVYQADAEDKEALEQLGFKDLDHVIVSVGHSMEASILVAMNLQELGVPKVWVKAMSEEHQKVLDRLGVDMVVFPEQYVARQLAYRLAVPGLLDYLALGEGIMVREVKVDKWAGQTLRDLNLPSTHNIQVVAVKSSGAEEFSFVPRADVPLKEGDVLVLLGKSENVLEATQ